MKEIILAYQGEMTLKGLNRSKFEARLAKSIRYRLEDLGKFKVTQAQSTVFIEPLEDDLDMDEAFRRISKIFGIVKMSRAACCSKDFDEICATAEAYLGETLRGIRTIHTLRRENYMEKAYDEALDDSFAAVEKTNFYDACYSPVILIMNAAVVALVMLLSAAGSPEVRAFFGMSVGTAVAVIAYISQVFTPLESIGMEIETIQSAVAGVRRINGFLAQAERIPTAETAPQAVPGAPSVELQNVHFGYESDEEVLHGMSFAVQKGEQVTLTGRTGAGKSTIFKLLLGLYRPQQGKVMLNGVEAATLPDTARRPLVGYVEQSFRRVPGTVRDQITLFDAAITPQQAEDAARTVGLHDAIAALPEGYDTPCTPGIFSQGQWQLLSIARAIAAGPQILLLDEITANLDAGTEQTALDALQRAGQNRTVVSISHRLYNRTGGRSIEI